jgi:uncharacterized SAM-binding protein YcdF (DUF218 family)
MKKIIVYVLLIFIAAIGILDTIVMKSRSGGLDMGIMLPGVFGACILLGLLFTKTRLYRKRLKFYNKAGKVLLALFLVWLVSFIAVTTLIMTSAISQKEQKVDCVFVLGAGLKGETPSLVLKERLDYTIEYLKQNPDVTIVVTGGQGFGETITEAEGMKRYLVRQGVPEGIILKEESATSTYENMIFSKKLYQRTLGKSLDKVMIITNDFHMFRSKILAQRAGLKPFGISSGTPWYIYPNVCLREYLALFKSLIFDR